MNVRDLFILLFTIFTVETSLAQDDGMNWLKDHCIEGHGSITITGNTALRGCTKGFKPLYYIKMWMQKDPSLDLSKMLDRSAEPTPQSLEKVWLSLKEKVPSYQNDRYFKLQLETSCDYYATSKAKKAGKGKCSIKRSESNFNLSCKTAEGIESSEDITAQYNKECDLIRSMYFNDGLLEGLAVYEASAKTCQSVATPSALPSNLEKELSDIAAKIKKP